MFNGSLELACLLPICSVLVVRGPEAGHLRISPLRQVCRGMVEVAAKWGDRRGHSVLQIIWDTNVSSVIVFTSPRRSERRGLSLIRRFV